MFMQVFFCVSRFQVYCAMISVPFNDRTDRINRSGQTARFRLNHGAFDGRSLHAQAHRRRTDERRKAHAPPIGAKDFEARVP